MNKVFFGDSGIYKISNTINGKIYVGSASNIRKRWSSHKRAMQKGVHDNQILQRSWILYGESSFEFSVIEIVANKADLIAREQFWIDELRAIEDGYNISPKAGSRLGVPQSDKTKEKISIANKGKVMSPDSIAKTVAANTGRKNSLESRIRMSLAQKGKVMPAHTEKAKERMSLAAKGKSKSPEHKAKLSMAAIIRCHRNGFAVKRKAQQNV